MHTPVPAAPAARSCGFVLFVTLAACSSGSATPSQKVATVPEPTSVVDSGVDSGPTPSPGNCYPTSSDTGNSKNVGAYCTKSGGQCSDYSSTSLQCSSDLSAQGGNFCLLVGCSQDTDCGEDSCCTAPVGSPISACIPIGCFDAGVCSPIAP